MNDFLAELDKRFADIAERNRHYVPPPFTPRTFAVVTGNTDGLVNPIDGKRYLSPAQMERENYARGYVAVGNETEELLHKGPARRAAEEEASYNEGLKEDIQKALATSGNNN